LKHFNIEVLIKSKFQNSQQNVTTTIIPLIQMT